MADDHLTRIGRFQIIAPLGHGAMGHVYRAVDAELGRQVAIKLRYAGAGFDLDGDDRLRREAQALARLVHPNVVAVFELGRHEQTTYVAMEYVDGVPLDRWLASPRAPREVIDLLIGVGHGLAAAHAVGLVHRDVKPRNIFVSPGGVAKIGDFGLVRVSQGPAEPALPSRPKTEPVAARTVAGSLVGTPTYMSPEQLRGEVATERSDQFSFCVTLFEALSGARPFVGHTIEELLAAIGRGPPRTALHAAPRRARAVLARGLALEPARRFGSMTELLAALARPTRRIKLGVAMCAAAALAATAYVVARPETATEATPPHAHRATQIEDNHLRLLQAEASLHRDPSAAAAWLKTYQPATGHDETAGRALALAASAVAGGIAQHILTLPGTDAPSSTCLASDGGRLAVVSQHGAVWLFDLEARTRRRVALGAGTRAASCRFMVDDRQLVVWTATGEVAHAPVDGGPAVAVALAGAATRVWPAGDRRLLALAGGDVAQLVELADSSARAVTLPSATVRTAAAPDGRQIYAVDAAGTVFAVPGDGAAAVVLARLAGPVDDLSVGDDGRLVVVVRPRELVAIDRSTGAVFRLPLEPHGDPVFARATGDVVVLIAGRAQAVSAWRPLSGERTHLADGAYHKTLRVQASPSPRALWSSQDGLVHVAELDRGRVQAPLGDRHPIRDLELSRSGTALATVNADEIRVFQVAAADPRTRQLAAGSHLVRQLRDAAQLLVVEAEHRLAIVDATTMALTPLATFTPPIVSFVGPARGPWIALCLGDGHVVLRSTADASQVDLGVAGDGCSRLAAPDDETLAVASRGGEIDEYRVPSPSPRSLGKVPGTMYLAALRDRRTLIVVGMRQLSTIDRATGAIATMADQGSPIFGFGYAADGGRVAVGLTDGRVQLFEPATGKVRELGRMTGFVGSVQVTPDRSAVIASDEAGHVTQLSMAGAPPRSIGEVAARLTIMRLSRAGRWLAAATADGEIHLWDLVTGGSTRLHAHATSLTGFGFLGEHAMYSLDQSGLLAVWPLDDRRLLPTSSAALAAWLEAATSVVIDGAGLPRTPVRDVEPP